MELMDAMAAERGIDPGLDVRINPLALVDLRDDFEAQQECGRLMVRFVQALCGHIWSNRVTSGIWSYMVTSGHTWSYLVTQIRSEEQW